MKQLIKNLIKKIPVSFTLNQKYDVQTKKVIRRVCTTNSNCIDIGCHKGEVLDIILKQSPEGKQFVFEPIPDLYQKLKEKYTGCNVYQIALSNTAGEASFNYVVSNPAYSGLVKRKYDRKNEVDTTIRVKTATLDSIIPPDIKIDFIKIDVEGGELLVLEGAVKTIQRCKPVIIFEHGIGASDYYESTPQKVYTLLHTCGLHISTMHDWLGGKGEFSLKEFEGQYTNKLNYYFIAYPGNTGILM